MNEEPERLQTPETQTLRELLDIMNEHDLDAIKVKIGAQLFELVRRQPAAAGAAQTSHNAAPISSAGAASVPAPVAGSNVKKVTAPLVGVFYRSASPDTDPFVKEGDRVEAGDVVCILEAMKLFNEITTDYAGVVARIVPENGELVTLGQELFWIEP